MGRLVLAIAAICTLLAGAAIAAETVTITNATPNELLKLQVADSNPPIPDWLTTRFEADPRYNSAVPLSNGNWAVEVRVFTYGQNERARLYVMGFPQGTLAQELLEFFAPAGKVVSVTVSDSVGTEAGKDYHNQSATVWMSTSEEAQAAVAMFHDQQWGEQKLHVSANAGLIIERGHLEWELYDAAGRQLPLAHKPRGSGWEDRAWPGGFFETLMNTGTGITSDENNHANWTNSGGYVFLYDHSAEANKRITAAFKHLDGTPVIPDSDGSYTLDLQPYVYFRELTRHQITGDPPQMGDPYRPN